MSRRWIFVSWMSIVVAALAAVLMLQHDRIASVGAHGIGSE